MTEKSATFAVIALVINLIVYSLAIAMSIYMTRVSTKKFKYKNEQNFGIKDMAMNLNNMLGRNKEADKSAKKKKDKIQKYKNQLEALDVQSVVSYTVVICILTVISSLLMYFI